MAYIEKCLEFDTVIPNSQKGQAILYNEKGNAFCLKGGVLLGLKISDFGWKRGVFFIQNPRRGGVFQTWGQAWYALVGSACVWCGAVVHSILFCMYWIRGTIISFWKVWSRFKRFTYQNYTSFTGYTIKYNLILNEIRCEYVSSTESIVGLILNASWTSMNQREHGETWWRHQMEIFSALLALCAGNSPVPGEFPTQRPVTRSFDVYFDLRPNKRLSKQWWGWWFETQSCSLWRHCNECNHTPNSKNRP